MKDYKTWNIIDLIAEQIKINAEIQARVKTVLDMENAFCTYNASAPAEKYKEFIEVALDLLRKGQK